MDLNKTAIVTLRTELEAVKEDIDRLREQYQAIDKRVRLLEGNWDYSVEMEKNGGNE
jgi:hypothetical protein